jgi:hypothetical protein
LNAHLLEECRKHRDRKLWGQEETIAQRSERDGEKLFPLPAPGLTLSLQHGVRHLHRDTFASRYWNWLPFTQSVTAVRALAWQSDARSSKNELGGFDEQFPAHYNDVDLSLRILGAGYRVIVEPEAVLQHGERSRIRGISMEGRDRFEARWADLLALS